MDQDMSLDRLSEAVSMCSACALGARGKGVPGMLVLPENQTPTGSDLVGAVIVLGEAPGAIEQERGQPFVGQSGELLHSMLKECGLESYYVSNIAKHQPFKDKHGKQQAPSKTEIEACAPFLRAEFDLVKPAKLILLGKTAAKLVVDGNFSMGKVVNQTFEYGGKNTLNLLTDTKHHLCHGDMDGHTCLLGECEIHYPKKAIPTLILYHPAYFLRQRTAPWIQKQIRDWKSAVRLFLGAKAPTYQIEEVKCEIHN